MSARHIIQVCFLAVLLFSNSFAQSTNAPAVQTEDDLISTLLTFKSDHLAAASELLTSHKKHVSTDLWNKLIEKAWEVYSHGDSNRTFFLFETAKLVAEQLRNEKLIGTTYFHIGSTHHHGDNTEAAIKAYLASASIFDRAGLQTELVRPLSELGSLYLYIENYQKAKEYSEKTLTIANKVTGNSLTTGTDRLLYGAATALKVLGHVSKQEGSYEQAIAHFGRALDLLQQASKTDPNHDYEIVECLKRIAQVHRIIGDHASALTYFNKALAAAGTLPDKENLAAVLISMSNLYLEQRDYVTATDLLNRSLQISLQQKNRDNADLATIYLNLGVSALRQGNYAEARKNFELSLENAERADWKDAIIAAHEGIGLLHRENGDYARAMESLEKGWTLVDQPDNPTRRAELLWCKAEVHYAMGNFADAIASAEKAVEVAKAFRFPNVTYLASTILGKAFHAQKKYDRAYEALSQAIDQIESMRTRVAGQEQERQLFFEDKVGAYHLMVDLMLQQGDPARAFTYAEQAKGRVVLDVLRNGRDNNHLESKIKGGLFPPFKVEDTAQLLPDARTALLEYVVTENTTYLFVLTKSAKESTSPIEIRVFPINIERRVLAKRVQNFRTRLAYNLPDFRAFARDLHDLLIKPAEANLQGKSVISVVPDGPLWELPFQALQTSAGKYLLELHAISYAPSLQVLCEMRSRADMLRSSPVRRKVAVSSSPSDKDYPQQLLAVGNPTIGGSTAALKQPFRDSPFDPMPEAETEVRNIARLWGLNNSRVYVGPVALEETFKAEAGKYRIIHLAAHGVLDDKRPLYSYVLLATNNNSKEDGRLEAWELMKMNLQAEIVVLSACELGRGDVSAGEGMIGMTWALFVAGVPTTVASQWKVESKNTTRLMEAFHRNLLISKSGTITKAEALRQASLEMMRDPQYRSQPFYWAGFVLLGDGL